jgi:hypothetical protein
MSNNVGGDDLTPAYASASFSSADVGTWPVSVSGISLGGSDAGNYTFNTTAGTSASITPKGLTVSFTAANKPYDGNAIATITGCTVAVVIVPDAVTCNSSGASASFANALVGSGKTVTGSGFALGGAQAPNYTISGTNTTTASIGGWTAAGFHPPIGSANSIFQPPTGAGTLATAPLPNASTIWNSSKGGSTIPLKFNVYAGAVELTSVASTVQSFTATKLSTCATGAGEEDVEQLASAGNTELRYTDGQFIQNWKTAKVSRDECYRVALVLADSSAIYTFIKLKK